MGGLPSLVAYYEEINGIAPKILKLRRIERNPFSLAMNPEFSKWARTRSNNESIQRY